MTARSYSFYTGVGVVTAALALGSSFGIKIHGFSPRELAIGAEGEKKEWMGKPSRMHGSNPDGSSRYALRNSPLKPDWSISRYIRSRDSCHVSH
jgi:hypothetical protein